MCSALPLLLGGVQPALCWDQGSSTSAPSGSARGPSSTHVCGPSKSGLQKPIPGRCTNRLASSHSEASSERVCVEPSVARHLEGHELELAEELLFQCSLPPLSYFSFKNKFLNISPESYAKPQSSI